MLISEYEANQHQISQAVSMQGDLGDQTAFNAEQIG